MLPLHLVKKVLSFIFLASLFAGLAPIYARKPLKLRVLQWNVWQEGTTVSGGFNAIVDEIVRLQPDFVTLSEVRNYHNTNFTRRLCDALQQKGATYHSFYSYDTGLLSRWPIADSVVVFPCNKDHGSIHKLTSRVKGRTIHVYTAHLDYLDDAYYNVRGYDGNTWREVERPKDVKELLRMNDASWRDDATRIFLNEARHDLAEGGIVILGGDFNEPSWQDWTPATAQLFDHHGFVVPWTVTRMLTDAGFRDAFREHWPDPVAYPGFTYPTWNTAVSIGKLTWAPKADERERIDYIFYQGKGARVVSAEVFGPDSMVCRSRPVGDAPGSPLVKPLGTWPSDHRGVLVDLEVK